MKLLFIAVLAFSAISVSRAEESLFVLKGGSVHLDVQGYEGLRSNTLYWNLNSIAILEYSIRFKHLTFYKDYNISTEFYQKNFTLLLKNVQERDSGIYTARITDIEGQPRDVASYRLTVQEAPPTPEVEVALLSSAGGSCNVSVNCSAKDTRASYICDQAHCTQVANTTSPTGVNIIVTATNGTVHCSSSNRVGTTTQSESTKDICTPINENNQGEPWRVIVGVTVGVTVGVIVAAAVISITVIYKKRRKSGGSQIEDKCKTEYASVQGPGVVHSNPSTEGTVYETVTTAKPEHHSEGITLYDTLGPGGYPPTKAPIIYDHVIIMEEDQKSRLSGPSG